MTKKNAYPIGNIADNISRLSGSDCFTLLDSAGAFHCISIRPQDREITAFSTRRGHFEFVRLPFGLCNGPASYCQLIQRVLHKIPLDRAFAYLDDVIVHSKGVQQHLVNLEQVLMAHLQYGLRLQPSKCEFLRKSAKYLGHVITMGGFQVDPEKVDIVVNWPTPTKVVDLMAFLGLCNY